MVTFKNWALDDAIRMVPAGRLMIETDAPYLAPIPHRGKRNEPAYVKQVAERIAAVRGTTYDVIAAETTQACREFFAKSVFRNSMSNARSGWYTLQNERSATLRVPSWNW